MRRWVSGFGCVGIAVLALSAASFAWAQEAPAPRRMPREPVAQQVIAGSRTPVPPSRNLAGAATIIDTERLRIGDIEMRLFGVVPPSLSASFGPQARAVLDTLNAAGAVTCTIRDRDRDGRFLATCLNANKLDLAIELLRRGLAVTARGSLRPTELAAPYLAAEQAAQAQKLGLWSITVPAAASESSIHDLAQQQAQQQAKDAAAKEAAAKADASSAPTQAAKQDAPLAQEALASVAVPAVALKADAAPSKTPVPAQKPDLLPQPVSGPTVDEVQAALVVNDGTAAEDAPREAPGADFFERYQILLSGVLMLFTALAVALTILLQRRAERREELRSIAAAIRGELMAARAVCLARLQSPANGADDKNAAQGLPWPKIRILVFQAYVGRIGKLGAELARQVASIYGLASDYAAYYATTAAPDARLEPVSKRQALQALINHIDEVLPSLAVLEKRKTFFRGKKGSFFTKLAAGPKRPARFLRPAQQAQPMIQNLTSLPPSAAPLAPPADLRDAFKEGGLAKNNRPQKQNAQTAQPVRRESAPVFVEMPKPESVEPSPSETEGAPKAESSEEPPAEASQRFSSDAFAPLVDTREDQATVAMDRGDRSTAFFTSYAQATAQPSPPPMAPGALWGMLRKFASEHIERSKPVADSDSVPDYTNLTEAEMEALAYGTEPLDELPPPAPVTQMRRTRR